MLEPLWTSLALDDEERPGLELEDEELAEPDEGWDGEIADTGDARPESATPPQDEDHMLARLATHGERENGGEAEGDELMEDSSSVGCYDDLVLSADE